MSQLTNRIVWEDNTTLNDLSMNLNKPSSGTETIPYTTTDDFIYIGSTFPFNQRHFRISSANAIASTVTVEYWAGTGNTWKTAVDVIDGTSSGGASMAQDGTVTFTTDKDEPGWVRQDTDKMTGSGLETLKIYDLYWARLSWSATWTVSTALQFVGYKFSDDTDFATLFPQLNTSDVKTQFSSGKTDWTDQTLEVSEMLVRQLKKRSDLSDFNQILDAGQFKQASVYRLAMLIFNEFGDDFNDEYARTKELFEEAVRDVYRFDRNRDAQLDHSELFGSVDLVRR